MCCWNSFFQGFETRTGPYGPTRKTSNRSCLRFVKPQEPLHGKIAGTRENHGRTSRFWEPWSNRFSRFPASVNLKLKKKKKKKQTNTEKQKKKKHNSVGSTSCLQKHCHCHLQRNTTCLYVSSSSSLFRVHHAAPSIQKFFSWANQALNFGFVLRR